MSLAQYDIGPFQSGAQFKVRHRRITNVGGEVHITIDVELVRKS